MLPDVTILATTYYTDDRKGNHRRRVFDRCAESWGMKLLYPGGIALHIADDGSKRYSPTAQKDYPYGFANFSATQQERRGLGASFNNALGQIKDKIILHAVDDWLLKEPLDIEKWVALLEQDGSIGAVRIGMAHPGLTGRVERFEYPKLVDRRYGERDKFEKSDGLYLRLDRHNYVFSFRPVLFHRRFFEHYGAMEEGVSALEVESIYNVAYCADSTGPDIVLALHDSWQHIETGSLASVVP